MKNKIRLPDLIIYSGQTVSGNVLSKADIRFLSSITIAAPAVLPETVNVQTSSDDGATWQVFQSPPGTDVVIGAGKSITILEVAFTRLRLSSGTTAADRTFKISATEEI